MARTLLCLRVLALPLSLILLMPVVSAQGGRVNREKTWPAPTAEDWKRPCLITWQRTWADAVALSRETGRPILICVNMDGEIASEHYAGIRYRQPEIAALYKPYVAVIASVYRHSPRDHDEQGRRILCPRFGSVTCGEHIAIEPGLFERFFDGKRIAPRHNMVELDGKEKYDVYYTWDTESVFRAIRDGFASRPSSLLKAVRGDRSIIERVASRDSRDRTAVEAAYGQGDHALRRSLLEAAIACGDAMPMELLRLAVYGFDAELSRMARRALVGSSSENAIDLIADALRVPMQAEERDALIAALERLGGTSNRARRLAVVHRGLARGSRVVDLGGWSEALGGGGTYPPAPDSGVTTARLEGQDSVFGSGDAGAHVELAEAFLDRALESATGERRGRSFTEALFMDARDTALEAERLGATGWRLHATLAIAALHLGDAKEAHARAEVAVRSGLPPRPQGRNAMLVLALFAEARHDSIVKAVREKRPWPGQWLTDMHAAHTLLMHHPHGDDSQVVSHYDFLAWLGARGQAARFLDEGLARFPDSPILHDRLRARILREKGVDALETVYEEMLRKRDALSRERSASGNLEWFAGYASLLAAEYHRRAGRIARSLASYGRSIAHFDSSVEVNPEVRSTADHYVALALAGCARLALERGDHARALAEVLASFDRRPGSAASLDGLNISAIDTARMLLARLRELKQDDLARKLERALGKLDPGLLRLPAYERMRRGRPPGGGRRPPRRRGAPQQGRQDVPGSPGPSPR